MRAETRIETIPRRRAAKLTDIRSVDDYDRATQRVAELAGALEDTPEERELIGLVDAIEAWDREHDDATRWQ